MNERQAMLTKVQQLGFVLLDVGLYLNNHPEDEAALSLYSKYQALVAEATQKYEEAFGPLRCDHANAERDGWSWVEMPWPWQMEV